MSSFRVGDRPLPLKQFDVVGTDGKLPHFIAHVGLAESDAIHGDGQVPVLDMGPPVHGPGVANHIAAHVVGRADLEFADLQKIRTFVDQHANEHALFLHLGAKAILRRAPEMYSILPHAAPFREEDGRYSRMRFSCVGFTLEAYRSARILLVDLDKLPAIEMETIRAGYPHHARLLDRDVNFRDVLGLTGEGPWPVLLCGYLFHALDRTADDVRDRPYAPTEGTGCFPQPAPPGSLAEE